MYCNGTPLGVPQVVKGQQLPINQLKGNPPIEDCSISNVHRCTFIFSDALIKRYLHICYISYFFPTIIKNKINRIENENIIIDIMCSLGS
jgi:hypothetical protein